MQELTFTEDFSTLLEADNLSLATISQEQAYCDEDQLVEDFEDLFYAEQLYS